MPEGANAEAAPAAGSAAAAEEVVELEPPAHVDSGAADLPGEEGEEEDGDDDEIADVD